MNSITVNSIAFYTLFRREVMRFMRIWIQTLVPSVITVSLYFFIFGNLIGQRIGLMKGIPYIQYIVPGLIMMSIITNSYANVVSSFFGAKFQKHIEEMLVSPMPSSIILLGFILGGVARGFCVGLLVTLVSLLFTKIEIANWGLTLLVGFLTAILFSLAGLINGIFAKKFDDISIVPTFILTPLTYLGGVFYSVSLLPPFWGYLTYINPVFYIVNAFRFAMLGYSDASLALSMSIIVGSVILLYSIAYYLINKGIGLRT